MLTHVVLNSDVPRTLQLESVDPEDTVILKSISGLLPADVTNFMGEYAGSGGYYQGRRFVRRNPVLNLKLNPNFATNLMVNQIREELYQTFYSPRPGVDGLQIILHDDVLPARYVVAYVEKWDGDIFAKSTDAQISMLTTESLIQSAAETSGYTPSGWLSHVVNYEGSQDTGVLVEIRVTTDTPTLVFRINDVWMTLVRNFTAGQLIRINTREGSRSIKIDYGDGGRIVDIMTAMDSYSRWPQLRKGPNVLQAYSGEPNDSKALILNYKYRAEWLGV